MEIQEIQSAVRSLTRGRARIRHERLRGIDNETRANVESFLLGLEGVTSVCLNPRVGSLLITWDETKTHAESLLESAGFFLAFLGDSPVTEDEENAERPCADVSGTSADESKATTILAETKATIGQCVAPTVQKIAPALKNVEKAIAASGGAALDLLAPLVAPDQQKGGRKRRVTQNRLMLLTYLASIGILAVGAKRFHWVLGTGFTALLGVHLYQHSRVL